MIAHASLLVNLVMLIDQIPSPPESPDTARRSRGRPVVYSDRLFLKALVIMIVKRLYRVHTLYMVLSEPTAEMRMLRALLSEGGRYPSRRTFDRRLGQLPETLPAQIGALGRHLVRLLQPWAQAGRAAALDSTLLRARGGVWHKKDRQRGVPPARRTASEAYRQRGVVPHTRIDTEAHWTKSGHHGWVYGWKLHVAVAVGVVWIPLAACLRAANHADNKTAPELLRELPPQQVRFVLGDTHYNAPNVEEDCRKRGIFLVASGRRGTYPHTDDGVEVRRVFHKLRSVTNENFNEQFKAIFEGHEQVPTKGLAATERYALGGVLVYQLALLYRHEHRLPLREGLKAFLKAA